MKTPYTIDSDHPERAIDFVAREWKRLAKEREKVLANRWIVVALTTDTCVDCPDLLLDDTVDTPTGRFFTSQALAKEVCDNFNVRGYEFHVRRYAWWDEEDSPWPQDWQPAVRANEA
jgi:hypothetical protein